MFRNLLLVASVTILAGCSTSKSSTITDAQAGEEKGWHCYQSPNSLDVPGQVFRVNDSGVKFREANYSQNIETESGLVVDSVFVQSREIEAKVLANLIAVPSDKKPSIFGNLNNKRNVKIEIKDRKINATNLQDIVYIKGKFLSLLNNGGYEEDSKYYVIRESISAKNINISFDKGFVANAGGEAELKKVVDTNASLKFESGESYKVEQNLNEFATVCIKPMEFAVTRETGNGYGGVSTYRVDVVEPQEKVIFTSSQ